jgi:hypothetical protein
MSNVDLSRDYSTVVYNIRRSAENLNGRYIFEDLDVDGKMILKFILVKYDNEDGSCIKMAQNMVK